MNKGKVNQDLVLMKIYDPILRIIHWWNALALFSIMLTIWLKGFAAQYDNGKNVIYHLHILIGYGLTAGILARIIWGCVGGKHSKFRNMFFVKEWISFLKIRKYQVFQDWGHDKYASLSYLLFYFIMLYQIFSGFVFSARKYGIGPFAGFIEVSKEKSSYIHYLKELHEIFFYVSMIYVLIHVGMIIFHEIKEQIPISQSMLSGYQFRKRKK